MFCRTWGKPPSTARGAWTSRGILDWNHATELLKLHSGSKWHNDAVLMSRIVEQPSVVEIQNAAVASQKKQRIEETKLSLPSFCGQFISL